MHANTHSASLFCWRTRCEKIKKHVRCNANTNDSVTLQLGLLYRIHMADRHHASALLNWTENHSSSLFIIDMVPGTVAYLRFLLGVFISIGAASLLLASLPFSSPPSLSLSFTLLFPHSTALPLHSLRNRPLKSS